VSEEELTELGHAFQRAYRNLRSLRGRDTHLVGGELGHAQSELLIELRERGPLPIGELAEAASLQPATVSQMLDALAGFGYVERVRTEKDRRVVVAKLTRRGRARTDKQKELWRVRWEEALEGVDPADLHAAALVLERIATVFEEP
jgi:DNA-binding MarR family transcriptional regulator